MSKGWVVVRFMRDGSERPRTVKWFEEQFEAEEEAERLNEQSSPEFWYGWERNT